MSSLPSDLDRQKSLALVTKLFGLSTAIALGIKYGITIFTPGFTLPTNSSSGNGAISLDQIATIAIITPSLFIAIVLFAKSRKSKNPD